MVSKKENIEKIRVILEEMREEKQIDHERYKSIWQVLDRLEKDQIIGK
jgi:ribosomal protein L19E